MTQLRSKIHHNEMYRPGMLCIYGPTASNKTDLACRIADEIPSIIIHVDSSTVYQKPSIATAKPDDEVLQKYIHRVIDIVPPTKQFSSAKFCVQALIAMQEACENGRLAILSGGTFFYFKSLLNGLTILPGRTQVLRVLLENLQHSKGSTYLYQKLATLDLETAITLYPNDKQRIIRALEVCICSGRPINRVFREKKKLYGTEKVGRLLRITLSYRDKKMLHRRIEERFDKFLEDGLTDEVIQLILKDQIPLSSPGLRCVGYREVCQFLSGEICYSLMRKKAIISTRQLAKKQFTWMRKMPTDLSFMVDEQPMDRIAEIIVATLKNPTSR